MPIRVEYDRARYALAPERVTAVIVENLTGLTQYVRQWIYEKAPTDTSQAKESLADRIEDMERA